MVAIAQAGPADRDARVIGLVSTGHFFSHFLQLCIPALFPVLKLAFGVSYTELGDLMTGFYAASGLAQTPSGFLVDRFGADRVLIGGLALLSGSIALVGAAPSFWTILPLTVLAGIGNSVFHPADYAILTGTVTPRRMARAYAVHSIGGTLGWAAAPVATLALSGVLGWRGALVAVGAAGLGAALLLASQRHVLSLETRRAVAEGTRRDRALASLRLLTGAAVLSCFGYFTLLSLGQIALQTFLPTTLNALWGIGLAVANTALTAFLLASAAGTLAGGIIADRLHRHEAVVGAGLILAAMLTLVAGAVALPDPATIALVALIGALMGMTMPSRDMLVRAATPRGATGRVFGFVYSGLDLGAALAPAVAGRIIDAGAPAHVFTLVAVSWVATIAVAFLVSRQSAAPAAPGARQEC